eukprot:gnl/MRDRNA2_/MRDRNA2_105656_c0_seq1.p1 gnl/MRDRNA2_/MRDRNA2_105656_c0~~gnl/MRDRNA2_/MRDRNA2_105656_c0_seq1.p1  ORF type:complete len:370 (+),score=84.73 gnl/MRDRNA2_/MRDRNA2_105656_c0_seq1:74-1111(+)
MKRSASETGKGTIEQDSSIDQHLSKRICQHPVAILTLQKHRDGAWLTQLVKRLQTQTATEILDIDTLSLDPAACLPWSVVVNRVSDAAPSHLVKATLAIMKIAQLQGIPTINGPDCYSIGISKMCHHAALAKVGLRTPRTIVCRDVKLLEECCLTHGLRFPILLKPNAGGFGAGIMRLDDLPALRAAVLDGSAKIGEDGVVLLQEYIQPASGKVYRVWTLGSKVQCAVEAKSSLDEVLLRGICMCNVTKLPDQTSVAPWEPPEAVATAVVKVMEQSGADCGSVELLWPQDEEKFGAEPYYFDVNMLSTLPSDKELLLPAKSNPWDELAQYILAAQNQKPVQSSNA